MARHKYYKTPVNDLDHDTRLYLAGLYDGEGSFMIGFSDGKTGVKMSANIRIAMTHRETIDWIAQKVGREVNKHNYGGGKSGNPKLCWRVEINNIEGIISFIEQILPFLITKKEAAKTLLTFALSRRNSIGQGRKGYGQHTAEEFTLRQQLKEINQFGLPN